MTAFAMTFPGQGSQSIGMLAELAESHAEVRQTFEEASDALGFDLWALTQNGPKEDLNSTRNTQPAMLAAGTAVWRVWQAQGGAMPQYAAGHSLGEYSAMVAASVFQFSDAVKLVAERGRLMQEAVPAGEGAMAAILGLEDDRVRLICEEAAGDQVAEAVNFNSPGQVVIAGNAAAIARAIDLAKEAGAKRALPLDVSVPSHCALMRDAADSLYAQMQGLDMQEPAFSVIQNVNVAASSEAEAIRLALKEQLYGPVRWVETVRKLAASGTGVLIEAGPGKVLSGLAKRIDRELQALPVYDNATLETALETLNG